MSRLEDKLSASIKPAKGKTTPTAKTATKGPRPQKAAKPAPPAPRTKHPEPAAAIPATAEEPARALHPRRVWPD
ncbi:MAG TPA: hypothetical protein PLW81_07700 [Thiobacillaceae bacterium]|nr:hypothetical protein [Thiobacillaceae bacterium]